MDPEKKPEQRPANKKLIIGCAAAAVLAVLALTAFLWSLGPKDHDTAAFQEKAELLRPYALADWVRLELGLNPAGSAGYAVFVSVCDGAQRASVYTGTGANLTLAWEAAVEGADKALRKSGLEPLWVKADVLYTTRPITMDELKKVTASVQDEFFRYGAAFDASFETALLEAELNGAKIYDYDDGGIDLEYLNNYLKKAGRKTLNKLPEELTMFQCIGWLCDGENEVHELSASGLDYGRRQVELVDGDFARELIMNASDFLEEQVQEDGSFVYGIYPRFDNDIDSYNILRHAGTIWSMLCRYRLEPDEALKEKIELAIEYMLGTVVYDGRERAYLYEEKSDEIKLGGCGIAVLALTEYMDVFESDRYRDVCTALGNGILSMLDQSDGTYYHVLNRDFSRKEEFRTVYYDGEATFALCRLYSLTEDPVWLEAAQAAVDHFIEADYTQYKDHWVSYSMNEITKYVTNRADYFVFALRNAQENLKTITEREEIHPVYLELLMSAFLTYDRMVRLGGTASGFDLEGFLSAVYHRANGQLDGYFFPEYAMYMENPRRVLDTFMVRNDGFRVRIDDVQHNIGGYYLYCVNYDKLVEYGMLDCAGVS